MHPPAVGDYPERVNQTYGGCYTRLLTAFRLRAEKDGGLRTLNSQETVSLRVLLKV